MLIITQEAPLTPTPTDEPVYTPVIPPPAATAARTATATRTAPPPPTQPPPAVTPTAALSAIVNTPPLYPIPPYTPTQEVWNAGEEGAVSLVQGRNVSGSYMNVRACAGISCPVLRLLAPGSLIDLCAGYTISASGYDWRRVVSPQRAYVAVGGADFVLVAEVAHSVGVFGYAACTE